MLTLGGRCEAQLSRRRAAAPLHYLGCLLDTSKLRYFGYFQPGGFHRSYSGHPVEMMSLSWGEGGLGTSVPHPDKQDKMNEAYFFPSGKETSP